MEDMSKDLNLSLHVAHNYAKVLAPKGLIKIRKIDFKYDIQILIPPLDLKPGYQLISEIEAKYSV